MTRQLAALSLAVAMSLGVAAPAAAQKLVDATNPETLRQIVSGFGSAEITTDGVGDPKITGRIDGNTYDMIFYGCTDDHKDCDDVIMTAAWSTKGQYTIEQMNEWNRTKRYGRAFIDDEGDPVLEMTINLDYGVSRKNFEDSLSWWRTAVGEFRSEVLKLD